MFEIGLSMCSKNFEEKLFADLAGAGIGYAEVSYPKNDCDRMDFNALAEWSKKYGVRLWSFHLPFSPFDTIDISVPELQKSTLEYFFGLIKKASDIGIDKFIVHPSGEPIADAERSMRLETAKESLRRLADYAEKCGAVIAVEDLPRTCLGRNSREMLELLSADERLRACLDTNHLLDEDLIDFIGEIKDKIITTHISDYDLKDEKHWMPGEGVIDWQKVVKALNAADYNGVWLYEIGYKAPNTITRARDLAPMDFKKNADEIFGNKPITKI